MRNGRILFYLPHVCGGAEGKVWGMKQSSEEQVEFIFCSHSTPGHTDLLGYIHCSVQASSSPLDSRSGVGLL